MNIKAQGFLNGVHWIEETYGRDALGRVVRACSPAVRERFIGAIAINWHPVEEFEEFLRVADEMLGAGDGKLAEELGAAGARANLRGVKLQVAVYVTKPAALLQRIAALWRQFNDEGEMALLSLKENHCQIEVRGVTTRHPLFCRTLTGWTREVGRAIGIIDPVSRHISCKCRGQPRCVWEVRWTKTHGQIG